MSSQDLIESYASIKGTNLVGIEELAKLFGIDGFWQTSLHRFERNGEARPSGSGFPL